MSRIPLSLRAIVPGSDLENNSEIHWRRPGQLGSESFRMPALSDMYISVRRLPMAQLHDLSTGDSVEVTGSFSGNVEPSHGLRFPILDLHWDRWPQAVKVLT
jgi:hypothetical protein